MIHPDAYRQTSWLGGIDNEGNENVYSFIQGMQRLYRYPVVFLSLGKFSFFKEILLFLLFPRKRNRDEHTNRQGLQEKDLVLEVEFLGPITF